MSNQISADKFTITALRSALDSGEMSATELTKECLQRIDSASALNAFIEINSDLALKQAADADKLLAGGTRSPLLGIPVAIKDNMVLKDTACTCGSQILKNFVSPYTATAVERMRAQGAVIVGKTNMDEFAMGSSNENSSFGPVKNPWDLERVPGGSSGGSTASVTARLVPAALGSDTGGSIRQPASLCGIVGMKPTYGRVSRYGLVAYASSLDQIGPLTTNVRDAAQMLEAISGHDPFDSTSVEESVTNYAAAIGRDVKGLRVGMPKEYFISGLQREVADAVKRAASHLESLGMKLVEISLPHTDAAIATYYVLAPAEASSNLARFDGVRYGHRAPGKHDLLELYGLSRSQGFGPEVKRRIMIGTYVLSAGYYDAYYRRAQKVRTLIAQDFNHAFNGKCDVILSPTSPTTAFKINEKSSDPLQMYLSDIYTIPVNLAGLPSISIPCGVDSSNLPIGLQLTARPWGEETLFQVAGAFEQSTEWHKILPKGLQ